MRTFKLGFNAGFNTHLDTIPSVQEKNGLAMVFTQPYPFHLGFVPLQVSHMCECQNSTLSPFFFLDMHVYSIVPKSPPPPIPDK